MIEANMKEYEKIGRKVIEEMKRKAKMFNICYEDRNYTACRYIYDSMITAASFAGLNDKEYELFFGSRPGNKNIVLGLLDRNKMMVAKQWCVEDRLRRTKEAQKVMEAYGGNLEDGEEDWQEQTWLIHDEERTNAFT